MQLNNSTATYIGATGCNTMDSAEHANCSTKIVNWTCPTMKQFERVQFHC